MPLRTGRRSIDSVLRAASLLVVCAIVPTASAQQTITTTAADSADKKAKEAKYAEEFGHVPGKFSINLGGFLPNVQTTGKLSTKFMNGTNINFEHRLGLTPSTGSVDGLASWRISKHNYLAISYFGFSRSSTKQLADSIIWGDNIYHAGATVDVKNSITYYGLTYRYYIWRERNWEVGPGLGIDALDLSSTIGVRGSVSDAGGSKADSAKKTGSVLAPVPLLGIYGDWEFVPRLLLKGAFQYIYINDIGGIGGHVSDDELGMEWYPFHTFGVGANYHFVGANVDKTFSNNDKLTFNYIIQGPALYLIATF
jgi:hypothetical protein